MEKNEEVTPGPSKKRRLLRFMKDFVGSSLLVFGGFTLAVSLFGMSIVESHKKDVTEAVSLLDAYKSAETHPQARAMETKIEQAIAQFRHADSSIMHGIFIQELAYQPQNFVPSRSEVWKKRDSQVRYSLRQLKGYNLKVFIDLLSEDLFVQEHRKQAKEHKELGIKIERRLVHLNQDERSAVKACLKKLDSAFTGNGFKVLYFRILDIINPRIESPVCDLHETIRPTKLSF